MGNQVTKSKSGESWAYGFDFRGQLVTAAKTVGGTTTRLTYSYDAFGNQISRNDGTNTTWYSVDGWDTSKPQAVGTENFDNWAELNGTGGTGALLNRRVYGSGFDEPIAKVESGNQSWYGLDHQNSVRSIFDNSGSIIGTRTYDAFGAVASSSGSVDAIGYTGTKQDAFTLLVGDNARAYDPATGRWIGEDSLRFSAGDPNLYRYVGNQATTGRDPSGMADPDKFTFPNMKSCLIPEKPNNNGFKLSLDGYSDSSSNPSDLDRLLGLSNRKSKTPAVEEKSILDMSQSELEAKFDSNMKETAEGLKAQLERFLSPNPSDLAEFARGVAEGFFVDGFWGTIEGIYKLGEGAFDIGKAVFNAHLQVNKYIAEKVEKGLVRPLVLTAASAAPEAMHQIFNIFDNRSIQRKFQDAQNLGMSTTVQAAVNVDAGLKEAGSEIFGDIVGKGVEIGSQVEQGVQKLKDAIAAADRFAKEMTAALIDIMNGRTPTLSPEVKKALTIGAVFASEMAKKVAKLSPNAMGRIYGWVGYQVVETVVLDTVTAGMAESARVGLIAAKLPRLRSMFKTIGMGEELAEQSFRVVNKVIDLASGANKASHGLTGCFAAGTSVLTPNGPRPIESLVPGDVVYAAEEDAGADAVELGVVGHRFQRLAPVWTLRVGGKSIRMTPEHPVYTLDWGWRVLQDIVPGDSVRGLDGAWTRVDGVNASGGAEVVYNIQVEGWHTFFVGGAGWDFSVWVHNQNVCDLIQPLQNALKKGAVAKEEIELAQKALLKHLDGLGLEGRKALDAATLSKLEELGIKVEGVGPKIGTQNPETAWATKTGRAYDRRFREFWRAFEGEVIDGVEVASVNRRLADGIQPDLVLIDRNKKIIRVHDITSRPNTAHLSKGEGYAKYFKDKYPGYEVEYAESYWKGQEDLIEATSKSGKKYLPGDTKP